MRCSDRFSEESADDLLANFREGRQHGISQLPSGLVFELLARPTVITSLGNRQPVS